jgi:hypothetical protein
VASRVTGACALSLSRGRARGIVGQGAYFVEAAKHHPALEKQWVEFLGEHPNAATERVETTEVHAA